MSSSTPDLFTPLTLGALELPNRIIMAPLTRSRSPEGRVPNDLNVEYYRQRAGAGMILSEATVISSEAVGYIATPGIYTDQQVEGWTKVTDAVHDDGGRILCQLWHVGRVSHSLFHDGQPPVSSVAMAMDGKVFTPDGFEAASRPRALETDEMSRVVDDYRQAARRASQAGFDGVEIHAANGYLLEQFLCSGLNTREDRYGGTLENRARLVREVIEAVVEQVPADGVGIKLTLGNGTNGALEATPTPMLEHLARVFERAGLAYVHLNERFRGAAHADDRAKVLSSAGDTPVLVNGDYDRERGMDAVASGHADGVVYGRPFIANPDLVQRFRAEAPLNEWDEGTFYGGAAKGYTDYPTLEAAAAQR